LLLFEASEGFQSILKFEHFFEKWGEIREVRDCKNSPNQKFIEYYDLRDCEKAFEEALNAKYGEGTLDVKYAFLQKKQKEEKGSESSSGGNAQSNLQDSPPNISALNTNPLISPSQPIYPISGTPYPYMYPGALMPGYDMSSLIQAGLVDPSQFATYQFPPGVSATQPTTPGFNPYTLPTNVMPTPTDSYNTSPSVQPTVQPTGQPSPQLQNLQEILSILLHNTGQQK
jgi:hypothetical protein